MLLGRTIRFVLAWALCSSATSLALAQTGTDSSSVRVQLKVSADAEVSAQIRRALEDELRSVAGVSVTDTTPQFTISVIALKVVTQSRKDVGATFSVVVSEPADGDVRQFAQAHLQPDVADQLSKLLSGSVKLLAHWVETAAARDIPQVCLGIIQSFERDVLRARIGDRDRAPAP